MIAHLTNVLDRVSNRAVSGAPEERVFFLFIFMQNTARLFFVDEGCGGWAFCEDGRFIF